MSKILGFLAAILVLAFGWITIGPASAAHAGPIEHGWRGDVVYIIDLTSGDWPLAQAAEKWDDNSDLDLIYTKGSICPVANQCIYAQDGNRPGTYYATTTWSYSGKYLTTATMTFDYDYADKWDSDPKRLLNGACHEIGHAIGLEHRSSTKSCMYEKTSTVTTGTDYDYDQLRIWYGN